MKNKSPLRSNRRESYEHPERESQKLSDFLGVSPQTLMIEFYEYQVIFSSLEDEL